MLSVPHCYRFGDLGAWVDLAGHNDTGHNLCTSYLPCFYCGDPYTERDHVFPISRIGDYVIDEIKDNLLIVPSCTECNRIAGNVVDPSLPDRKDRVEAVLRTRYREILSRPNHTEEELSTLTGRLRQEITRRKHKRRWLQDRIAY